ncbi:MAG: hypothetical protein ACXWU5_10985, partial [Rhodoplanes sp.]
MSSIKSYNEASIAALSIIAPPRRIAASVASNAPSGLSKTGNDVAALGSVRADHALGNGHFACRGGKASPLRTV